MNSMIDDYFGQSPKENNNFETRLLANIDAASAKKLTSNESSNQDNSETAKTNGKENLKVTGKGSSSKRTMGKSKISPVNKVPQVKKNQKNKSLSTKKIQQNKPEDKNLEGTDLSNTEAVKDKQSPAQKFSLKIRLKSQEAGEKDNFIEEFNSLGNVDVKPNELKSPQGTMHKYLIPQKNPSPSEKDSSTAIKLKVNRDISDYFSPSKLNETCVTPLVVTHQKTTAVCKAAETQEPEKIATGGAKNKTAGGKKKKTASLTPKSAKKSKQGTPVPKKSKTEVIMVATDSAGASDLNSKKNGPEVKPKSAKKSLSLTKNEANSETLEPLEEVRSLKSDNIEELSAAMSISTAFKNIMSKTSFDKTNEAGLSPFETVNLPTNKRKRDDSDDMIDPKLSKAINEDSPVRSKRRLSKGNQIVYDSDDGSTKCDAKNTEDSSVVPNDIDTGETAVEALPKLEESKRNSLMNYFAKVSREQVLAKEEKIEMKVKAMVHSPPTTPSKKTKRRSIHSLPGGAASLNKKKVNIIANLKETVNAIDVIDMQDAKGCDKKSKDSPSVSGISKRQPNPISTSSAKSVKSLSLKAHSSPQKNLPLLKLTDIPDVKHYVSPKTSKKSLSRGKGKQELKNNSVSDDKSAKSVKNTTSLDEESLAIPFASLKDEPEVVTLQTPSDPKTTWKLRVCLTPMQLPTAQGTLLEEESDCDDIFLQRKDKKRRLERQCSGNKPKQSVKIKERSSPDIIFEKEERSSVKIAPLFTRKSDNQARQLFLQSGVPDQVKRVLEIQRSFEEQETEIFPKKSHVQQINDKDWIWNLPAVILPLNANSVEEIPPTSNNFSLSDLTGCSNIRQEVDHIVSASCKGPEMRATFGLPLDIVKPILRLIKLESPDFKVVNTFKVLRSKFREDEFSKAAALSSLSEIQRPKRKSNRKSIDTEQSTLATYRAHVWTEKYKPSTASEIVGNSASIQQLKRWLELWRKASEDFNNKQSNKEEIKRKKKRKDLLDEDDFLVSENSSEGTQSNMPVGVAVLYGPNGSGKTSSVYALAKDLGYKVLEVNASEKRNGKLVLSKLSEATQSHQVQQGNTAEQGFAALFGSGSNSTKSNEKKKSRTKTLKPSNDSEEDKAKKMSLILFEDVDVVFDEEDEGFLSAISTLVSTSKRPVILTTTDPESPMVSRFINNANLNLPFFNPPSFLSTWLQIVSLLEGVYVAPDTVKNLVSLCKGDFRRALLQMQLWCLSGGNNMPMPSITYSQQGRKCKKDNNDDLSDIDDVNDHNCTPSIPANPDCIAAILGKNDIDESWKGPQENKTFLKVPFPLDLGLFWWNSPPLLSLKQLVHAELPVVKEDPSLLRAKRILDDSFLASFCTDDGSTTDNEDSGAPSSQATSIAELGESQEVEQTDSSQSQSSADPVPYTSCCSEKEMMAISSHIMFLSSIDVISHSSRLNTSSNMEPITKFSYPLLKDSLSLVKLEVDGPDCVLNSSAQEICHWLAEQSLNETRTCLCPDNLYPSPYNYCLPSPEEYRWRDMNAEAEQAALHAVPLCVLLDRRAISTDYMPTLRTFCRLERNRSTINTKRRNRFYHHLKSLGAHLAEAQLELLCHSMCDLYCHSSN